MNRCGAPTAKGGMCRRPPLAGRAVCQAHAPERATGRPTKLTPALRGSIVDSIREGSFLEPAARAAGIAPSTLYAWLERGEADTSGMFSEFSEAVRVAEARAEVDAVKQLRAAGERSWQATINYLERRFPRRWASGSGDSAETPPEAPKPDLTKLSDDELEVFWELTKKAHPTLSATT
ncbi:MAG: hypothetical protein EXQ70_08180 [Solirubrobacterales bacterium]|nr:hypothetical protein [Solirubrobacterales bacterium]